MENQQAFDYDDIVIAIDCGIAVGATGIAIPEIPFDNDALIEKILNLSLLKGSYKLSFRLPRIDLY